MKKILFVLVCVALLVSCASKPEATEPVAVSLDDMTPVQKYYYAMGNYLTSSYSMYYEDMDVQAFVDGVLAFKNGTELTTDELNAIVEEYSASLGAESLASAEAFLENNAKEEGVVVTSSGLQYKVTEKGTGASAASANNVTVDYELTLSDGTIADSSIQRGTPATFSLANLIPGFSEAVRCMNVGDTITAWIHPDLGYGSQGTGSIGPNELLTFTISLIEIVD